MADHSKIAFNVCLFFSFLAISLGSHGQSPSAPSFIKALREKHGLKSREEQREEDLNAKFRKRERDDEGDDGLRALRDDEQPVSCVIEKAEG
jgi:hypothetical protein